MRLLINVHFKEAIMGQQDVTPEDVARDLLEVFQNRDMRLWFISSVAIQPEPELLLHARDL